MKTTENLTEKEKETGKKVEIFCNKCGISCMGFMGRPIGLIEVSVCGEYDSTHLQDGDVYEFSLCEKCLKEMIDGFKLYAYKGDYLYPEPNTLVFDELDEDKQFRALVCLPKTKLEEWLKNAARDVEAKKFIARWVDEIKTKSKDDKCRREDDILPILEHFLKTGEVKKEEQDG